MVNTGSPDACVSIQSGLSRAGSTRQLAFILDMDGVVVDSNPVHRKVWRVYNRMFGIETDEAMQQSMYGRRNDDIVRHFFGAHLSDEEVARHGAAKESLYREILGATLDDALVPGVRAFLERHCSDPLALASNAEPANVDFVLERSGLRRYFRVAIDGQQVRRPKPDPEIYLLAAQRLGVRAADAVVFEDSEAGVAAARAAGMRTVGLRTTHPRLPGVDLEIDNFLSTELEPWLRMQMPHA